MKILVFALIAFAAPVAAGAQVTPSNLPPGAGDAYALTVQSQKPWGSVAVTPTMRQEAYDRTIALHNEAQALVIEDGGMLSDQHRVHVRRKAAAIRHLLGEED